MSAAELRAYREWFHENASQRIAELSQAVASSPGFSAWDADETPDSLVPLGEWFLSQVESRKRSGDELERLTEKLSMPIDVPDEELTNRSFSIAMDVGIYFGRVVVRNVPGTSWTSLSKGRGLVDYGQPVVTGRGPVSLNPVRVAVSLAYAYAAKEQGGIRLRQLYDVWSRKLGGIQT